MKMKSIKAIFRRGQTSKLESQIHTPEDLSRASSVNNLTLESKNRGAKPRKSASKERIDKVGEKRNHRKDIIKNNNKFDTDEETYTQVEEELQEVDLLQKQLQEMANEKTNLALELGEQKGKLVNLEKEISKLKMFQDQSNVQLEQLTEENTTLRNRLRDVAHSPLSDNEKQQLLYESHRHHSSAPASIATNVLEDNTSGEVTAYSTSEWDKHSSGNISEVSVACLQDKINQMQETHYSTNEELQATLQELTDLQRQLTELQQENDRLVEEKSLMFDSLCRQTERLNDSRSEVESLKQLLYKSKDSDQFESAAEREQRLVDLLKSSQEERESLLLKHEQLISEIQELRNTNEGQNEDIEQLSDRVRILESTLDAKHAEHKLLDQELAQAKDQCSGRQIEINRLKEMLENARTKIIELEQDRALSDKSELDELLDNVRKEKDALESEVADLKEQLAHNKNETDKLKEKVSILQEECKVVRNNAKTTQSDLEYKNEKLIKEKSALTEQLQQFQEALNELQMQAQCQLEDKRQLSSVLSETQRNLSESENKISSLENELSDLQKLRKEENEEWEKFQNDLLTSVRVANDFKTEAQQDLQKMILENKAHRERVKQLEVQIDKLKGYRNINKPLIEDIVKLEENRNLNINNNLINSIDSHNMDNLLGIKPLDRGKRKNHNETKKVQSMEQPKPQLKKREKKPNVNRRKKILSKEEEQILSTIETLYRNIDPALSLDQLTSEEKMIKHFKELYEDENMKHKPVAPKTKDKLAISKPLLDSVYMNTKLKRIVKDPKSLSVENIYVLDDESEKLDNPIDLEEQVAYNNQEFHHKNGRFFKINSMLELNDIGEDVNKPLFKSHSYDNIVSLEDIADDSNFLLRTHSIDDLTKFDGDQDISNIQRIDNLSDENKYYSETSLNFLLSTLDKSNLDSVSGDVKKFPDNKSVQENIETISLKNERFDLSGNKRNSIQERALNNETDKKEIKLAKKNTITFATLDEICRTVDPNVPESELTKDQQFALKVKRSFDAIGRKTSLKRIARIRKKKLLISDPITDLAENNSQNVNEKHEKVSFVSKILNPITKFRNSASGEKYGAVMKQNTNPNKHGNLPENNKQTIQNITFTFDGSIPRNLKQPKSNLVKINPGKQSILNRSYSFDSSSSTVRRKAYSNTSGKINTLENNYECFSNLGFINMYSDPDLAHESTTCSTKDTDSDTTTSGEFVVPHETLNQALYTFKGADFYGTNVIKDDPEYKFVEGYTFSSKSLQNNYKFNESDMTYIETNAKMKAQGPEEGLQNAANICEDIKGTVSKSNNEDQFFTDDNYVLEHSNKLNCFEDEQKEFLTTSEINLLNRIQRTSRSSFAFSDFNDEDKELVAKCQELYGDIHIDDLSENNISEASTSGLTYNDLSNLNTTQLLNLVEHDSSPKRFSYFDDFELLNRIEDENSIDKEENDKEFTMEEIDLIRKARRESYSELSEINDFDQLLISEQLKKYCGDINNVTDDDKQQNLDLLDTIFTKGHQLNAVHEDCLEESKDELKTKELKSILKSEHTGQEKLILETTQENQDNLPKSQCTIKYLFKKIYETTPSETDDDLESCLSNFDYSKEKSGSVLSRKEKSLENNRDKINLSKSILKCEPTGKEKLILESTQEKQHNNVIIDSSQSLPITEYIFPDKSKTTTKETDNNLESCLSYFHDSEEKPVTVLKQKGKNLDNNNYKTSLPRKSILKKEDGEENLTLETKQEKWDNLIFDSPQATAKYCLQEKLNDHIKEKPVTVLNRKEKKLDNNMDKLNLSMKTQECDDLESLLLNASNFSTNSKLIKGKPRKPLFLQNKTHSILCRENDFEKSTDFGVKLGETSAESSFSKTIPKETSCVKKQLHINPPYVDNMEQSPNNNIEPNIKNIFAEKIKTTPIETDDGSLTIAPPNQFSCNNVEPTYANIDVFGIGKEPSKNSFIGKIEQFPSYCVEPIYANTGKLGMGTERLNKCCFKPVKKKPVALPRKVEKTCIKETPYSKDSNDNTEENNHGEYIVTSDALVTLNDNNSFDTLNIRPVMKNGKTPIKNSSECSLKIMDEHSSDNIETIIHSTSSSNGKVIISEKNLGNGKNHVFGTVEMFYDAPKPSDPSGSSEISTFNTGIKKVQKFSGLVPVLKDHEMDELPFVENIAVNNNSQLPLVEDDIIFSDIIAPRVDNELLLKDTPLINDDNKTDINDTENIAFGYSLPRSSAENSSPTASTNLLDVPSLQKIEKNVNINNSNLNLVNLESTHTLESNNSYLDLFETKEQKIFESLKESKKHSSVKGVIKIACLDSDSGESVKSTIRKSGLQFNELKNKFENNVLKGTTISKDYDMKKFDLPKFQKENSVDVRDTIFSKKINSCGSFSSMEDNKYDTIDRITTFHILNNLSPRENSNSRNSDSYRKAKQMFSELEEKESKQKVTDLKKINSETNKTMQNNEPKTLEENANGQTSKQDYEENSGNFLAAVDSVEFHGYKIREKTLNSELPERETEASNGHLEFFNSNDTKHSGSNTSIFNEPLTNDPFADNLKNEQNSATLKNTLGTIDESSDKILNTKINIEKTHKKNLVLLDNLDIDKDLSPCEQFEKILEKVQNDSKTKI